MNLDATPHTGSELALSLQPHLVGVHATPVLGITTMGGQSRSEGGGLPLLLSKDTPHLEKHLPRAQQGLQFLFAPLCHLTLVCHWVGAAPRSSHLASYLCPSSRGLRGMEAGKEASSSWGGGYA